MFRPGDEDPIIRRIIDDIEQAENQLDVRLRAESAVNDTSELQQRIMQKIKEIETPQQRLGYTLVSRVYEFYKTAAAFILFGILVSIIFFGTVEAAREPFFTWVSEITSRYARLGDAKEPGETLLLDLPEGWHDYYYPTYLPDGYNLKNFSMQDLQRYLYYQNADGNMIMVWQGDKNALALVLDNEDAIERDCIVSGYPARLIIKGDLKMLTWRTENRAFRIDAYLADNEVIRIAENLKLFE